MYYSQGTISTVSGSAIVRGTGTQFKSNINGVAPAQLILIQSTSGNLLHMIQAVNSDTELVLADNVNVTLNNTTYQIQTTVPNSISDGVRHIVANTSYITQFLQNMDKWMSQNGVVDVTLPNGQTLALQSIRALQAAMLDKNKNGADIPNKNEFVKNLGLADTVERANNALPKTGGIVNGDVNAERIFSKSIIGIAGDAHGMRLGGADSASFDGNNLELLSWWGIGLKSSFDKQTRIYFDTRAGNMAVRGTVDASSLVLGSGSLEVGSRDAASFEGNNIEIRSWYGIGFRTTAGDQSTTIFFNTRNGDIETRGTIRAGNGTVMSLGQNCHSDGGGFIRLSSPIIQIHPDGSFTTNDESEGATVSKLGIGHYQVTGVLGYNADGAWGVHGGISSPKNNNGLELIYIDDKVQKDGSITIKT
uniref:phage tail fiber protein n=1 Tax=Xenorhabdus kozodoii TaxID=351676 RepID=UPI000C048814